MNRSPSRQPAFTLIETLISVVVVVLVLGSASIANRIIQQAAYRGEAATQLSALADESLDQVRLLRDNLSSGQDLGSLFGLAGGAATDQTASGLFVANSSKANPCS